MAEVMSSLGATALDPGQPQYVSKDVKTACPMYVGLGQNGMGFKKWYDTRFIPRVWSPKESEGHRAREKKMLQLMIQARTQLLKAQRSTRTRAPPQRREEEEEEELDGDGSEAGYESPASQDEAGGTPQLDPEMKRLMEQLADSELKTPDDQFECLVEYVSEAAQMKAAILEDIADAKLRGTARLDYFIEKMTASTATVVLQKAIWLGIARDGILEQPEAYSQRFLKAAEDCGRTKADINQRFMDTVLEPWEQEPGLRPLMPNFRAQHCLHVQDNEALHVKVMAATAFAYETMVAQSTVTAMERDGNFLTGQKTAKKQGAAKADRPTTGAEAENQSAQMGLPTKTFGSGKTYSACAACHVVRGKTVYHSPGNCPVRKAQRQEESGKAAAGAALAALLEDKQERAKETTPVRNRSAGTVICQGTHG